MNPICWFTSKKTNTQPGIKLSACRPRHQTKRKTNTWQFTHQTPETPTTKPLAQYKATIEYPSLGIPVGPTAGYQNISNYGMLGTFTGATVPAIPNATYDLDVYVDGVSYQLSFAVTNAQSWTTIVGNIQTALQTATSSTETVAISGGKIKITSATTGTGSVISISAGTAGSGGGDLITAINALPTTGTIALDSSVGNLFCLTPTQNTTINIATVPVGQRITFIVTTSGTSSYDITWGTNMKSTGVLATGTSSGKVFTIEFYSDGTNFNEISRTTAM